MNRPDTPAETKTHSRPLSRTVALRRQLKSTRSRQVESDKLVIKLQSLDHHKNQFLAVLAHELRSPLAPIKCALETMGMMQLNDEVESLRMMMNRQVDQVIYLTGDLLDIARISSGKIAIHQEVVDLQSIIASAVETSSTLIAQSGQTLTVSKLNHAVCVFADASRLTQVVSNLLNNAAKYSDPGCSIDLSVRVEKDFVTVRVSDNGIGIAADQLDNIFTLFTQLHNSEERGPEGLGIGLNLVKTLVELHGGTVRAESEGVGYGSAFTICLPLAEKPDHAELIETQSVQTADDRNFRILVIEDLRSLRLVMARLLGKLGHQVEVADSAADAIEKLQSFKPEVIFSDISMPEMSGNELVRLLRQRDDMSEVFFVAITGSGTASDRELAIQSGFDAHMTKPVDIRRLEALFHRLRDGLQKKISAME